MPIPFRDLPQNGQNKVLDSLRLVEVLAFSLCSDRAKRSVMARNRRIEYFECCLESIHSIRLRLIEKVVRDVDNGVNFYFSREEEGIPDEDEDERPIPLPTPDDIELSVNSEDGKVFYKWENPGLGFQHWLNHFITVLHIPEIDVFYFVEENYTRFDINTIYEGLPRRKPINSLHISDLVPEHREIARLILKVFDDTKGLEFRNPYLDSASFHKILVRNYESIEFNGEDKTISLDDLLITNSVNIVQGDGANHSAKSLNRFLKCWMRGSNFRMKYLCIHNTTNDVDDVMKGIPRIPGPPERLFRRKTGVHKYEDMVVRGGYDIWRRHDKVLGTLVLENHNFQFFVWDD